MRSGMVLAGLVLAAGLAACGDASSPDAGAAAAPSATADPTTTGPTASPPPTAPAATPPPTTAAPAPATATRSVEARPGWLGERVLPVRPDGLGEIRPTPPELVDRRFATVDRLAPPSDPAFSVEVAAVPGDVVARSTWTEECPVDLDELRYLTLPFVGFDGLLHTGELIVHADAVDAVTAGFAHLHAIGFPIEEMRVTRADELDAAPTGDGNNTGAFVCRPAVGSTSWSEHASGRAVDINPFHNPYVRGDVVVPELASAYADRSDRRPGMLSAEAVAGFVDAGWGWGGRWGSSKDHMHLSANGR